MSEDTQASGTRALSGRRLGAAALLLAVSMLLSRALGFVREMVLAARIGIGPATDAFSAAFQIPDILNYLLAGGALTIAFTPLYLRALEREGEAAASALFHTVLGTMGVLMAALTLLFAYFADTAIAVQFDDFPVETQALTTRLTRIVLPAQVFFVVGGVMRAVLMARGRFLSQAIAPLSYNGAIIIGGLLGEGIEGFAWGALAGAVIGNLVVPLIELRGVESFGWRIAPFDPRFRIYFAAALPLMIGVSLTTVDEWYERLFGQALGVGVLAALAFARRLMLAPVAIVGQAVATAALPTLAALHTEGRDDELDRTLLGMLRGTVAAGIVIGAAFVVFATPIVRLFYQRGQFDADDTLRVASLLTLLALGVPGWVAQQVAVRAFFARTEMWRPMLLGSALALLAIPVYLELSRRYGPQGLAAAGASAITANAVITLVWARLRFGGPDLGALTTTSLRALVIAGVAAGAGFFVLEGGPGVVDAVRDLALGGAVYGGLVLLGIWLLGDAALRGLVARAIRLVRRSAEG